jgi:GxxExxY protein
MNHRDTETQRKQEAREAMERDPLTHEVIGAAIEVHRELGPGLLERVYHVCLSHELQLRGIKHYSPFPLPVVYKGVELDANFEIDIYIPGRLVIELKAVERILGVHEAQTLTYMRLTNTRTGLLLNFNVPVLKDGIRRFVL